MEEDALCKCFAAIQKLLFFCEIFIQLQETMFQNYVSLNIVIDYSDNQFYKIDLTRRVRK